ncbi:MAG: YihY/virulence factor BrkB family protein, partial [Acidimicrobiia bacterium]|nr:YihY/virulence factor BrkB family protein [Acidimicrobiia bacterium]
GPAQRSRWRHDLPGAITAAVMWWLLSVGFGWYVSLTSGANEVLSAVGAGLLALTWIWLAAQVLLIGGTVNYLYGRNRDISRDRRSWNLNDRITGELRRIVVPGNGNGLPAEQRTATTAEPTAEVPAEGSPVDPRSNPRLESRAEDIVP